MNFDSLNLTPGVIGMMIALVALVVGFIVFFLIIPAIHDRKRKRATIEEIRKEDERIAGLPRLNTRYLIRIPESVTTFAHGKPRTFGNRYNRLIVFDERGDGWLGLFMPLTFQGFHDGEYIQQNYWVPFRGDGEMYAGDPVMVNGQKIYIYPIWMRDLATNIADWKTYAALAKTYDEVHRGTDCPNEFQLFTPFERSHELERRRQKFDAMRASLAPRKKVR